jgi:hypothetical protein
MMVSRLIPLRIRDVLDKSFRENKKTHILYSIYLFFSENRTVYEIMWKNIVGRGRPQMTIWRMRIACWIPKATKTNPQKSNTYLFSTATIVSERASLL